MSFKIYHLFGLLFVFGLFFSAFANVHKYPIIALTMFYATVAGLFLYVQNGLRKTHIHNQTNGKVLRWHKTFELTFIGIPMLIAATIVVATLFEQFFVQLTGWELDNGPGPSFLIFWMCMPVLAFIYLRWHFGSNRFDNKVK